MNRTEKTMDAEVTREIHIWDLPVRAVHWVQAVLVATSLATGFSGGNGLRWHRLSGYAILSLVLFRVVWGFTGGRHARFGVFLRGPRAVTAFVRETLALRRPLHAGHNPLAGWMVVALLASLLLQASSGLFANDDIAFEGPLAGRVAKSTSDWLTVLHQRNASLLIALVALHLAAVILHRVVERRDVVLPMITGRMRWPAERAAPDAGLSPAWLAAALFVLACTTVALVVNIAGPGGLGGGTP